MQIEESVGSSTMPSSMPASTRVKDAIVAGSAAVMALGVYVYSLLPGVGYAGDTAKFQFLGVVGGVPHATGYPLYLALDQVWVRIVPWGSAAWRVNLLSAVLGAATVAVLYVLLRVLDVRIVAAAAAAGVFAVTKTFWSQAVVAEVYTLHTLFLVAVTACLAVWRKGGPNAWLLAGLGLYAMSFGHHLTTIVALPGVAWIVWSDRHRAFTWRNCAFVAGAAVLGAAQYLYLMRLSDIGRYHEGNIDTFSDVINYATGGDFKDSMGVFSLSELLTQRIPLALDFMRQEYTLLLVPIAVGVVRGLWAPTWRRDVAVHLLWLAVGTSLYIMNYDVGDLVVFCIPLFLSLAVFLGLGLDAGLEWLESRWSTSPESRWAQAGRWGVVVGTAAVVVGVGSLGYSEASRRGDVDEADRMEHALDIVDDGSVLLTDNYHDSEYLWYYLLAEGLGDERGLALANQVEPGDVEQYFTGGTGPVAAAAQRTGRRGDPPLYTTASSQADDLAEIGLTVTPVADEVWRVSR